jgi:hypothetical protein
MALEIDSEIPLFLGVISDLEVKCKTEYTILGGVAP